MKLLENNTQVKYFFKVSEEIFVLVVSFFFERVFTSKERHGNI